MKQTKIYGQAIPSAHLTPLAAAMISAALALAGGGILWMLSLFF